MFGYLITDPQYYKDENFNTTLYNALKNHTPKFACFRDKRDTPNLYLQEGFANICLECGVIPILNGVALDRLSPDYQGVHLTSKQHNLVRQIKEQGLICIASCHTISEAILCIDSGADYVSISPVFSSPNKSQPLGIDAFCQMPEGIKPSIIALGGIVTKEHIALVNSCGVAGFASIRYFIKDSDA